jgi:hypothetical protein
MGRKKSILLAGDRYATLIICERAISMLSGSLTGLGKTAALCREHATFGEFDDLVERIDSPDSSDHYGWQVRQRSVIDPDEFRALLEAVRDLPQLKLGILALPEWVSIRPYGELRDFSRLCHQLRSSTQGTDLHSALTQRERRAVAEVARALSMDQGPTITVLRRFDVRSMGTADDVRTRIEKELAHLFGVNNHASALGALLDYLDSLDATRWIVPNDILAGPLSKLGSPQAPLEPLLGSYGVRERYLQRVVRNWQEYWPLGGTDESVHCPTSVEKVFIEREFLTAREISETTGRLSTNQVVSRAVAGENIAIIGEVGTGKTTWLIATAATLALRARGDESAPLPLSLHGRATCEDDWKELAARALAREGALMHSNSRWILLVDGIDEVGIKCWAALTRIRSLSASIVGVIAASRSVTAPTISNDFRQVFLADWSVTESERFLAAWEKVDPEAVATVRAQLSPSSELLENPLLATIAVTLAKQGRALPRGRTPLIALACELLFHDWRARRGALAITWDSIRSELAQLALRSLREEVLSRDTVASVLAQGGVARTISVLSEAERHLGLLVTRDGSFEFVFRAAAEYLAAGYLRAETNTRLVELAHTRWAYEPIRHLVALERLEGGADRARALIAELVQTSLREDLAADTPRPLLLGLDIVADFATAGDHLDGETRKQIVAVAVVMLFDETSKWMGEHAATRIRRVAHVGGVLWDELQEEIASRMVDTGDPADWWSSQDSVPPEVWHDLQLHRDPAVRAVALRRLAEEASLDDRLLPILGFGLLDEGYDLSPSCPAIVAGSAIRRLPTSYRSQELIDDLHRIVRRGSHPASGAAALALRPNETTPALITPALAMLAHVLGIPDEIIVELSREPAYAAAMDAASNRWRERRIRGPRPRSTSVVPPPSGPVRHRIVRACGPALSRMSENQRQCITARVPVPASIEILTHSPDWPGLLELRLGDLPFNEQRVLGQLALRRPEIAQQLINSWPTNEQELYPGSALEPMIECGDPRAVAIYAEWLPHSLYLVGFRRFEPPPSAVLRVPQVLTVARNFVLNILNSALKRSAHRLHLSSVANVLVTLTAAWDDEPGIVDNVFELAADESNVDGLKALLIATETARLAPGRRTYIMQRLRSLLASISAAQLSDGESYAHQALDWIEDHGLVGELLDVLRVLASETSVLGWHVFATMWPLLPTAERVAVSTRIAAYAVSADPGYLDREDMQRFISACPLAWCEAARTVVEREIPLTGTSFIPVLRALPRDMQASLLRHLQASPTAAAELPWQASGDYGEITGLACVRPADLIRQLLFENG